MHSAVRSCAHAGEADVVTVEASQSGNGSRRFDVTVAHEDEGRDRDANQWAAPAPDDALLDERVLTPPATKELSPRSLSGVVILPAIDTATIRARDSVQGRASSSDSSACSALCS